MFYIKQVFRQPGLDGLQMKSESLYSGKQAKGDWQSSIGFFPKRIPRAKLCQGRIVGPV